LAMVTEKRSFGKKVGSEWEQNPPHLRGGVSPEMPPFADCLLNGAENSQNCPLEPGSQLFVESDPLRLLKKDSGGPNSERPRCLPVAIS